MEGRYILFNPRQEHWDATRPGEMDYQVRWELDHLEEADIIVMHLLGSSKSPISLLEMGLHARSGKMHVIYEKDFYRCVQAFRLSLHTSWGNCRLTYMPAIVLSYRVSVTGTTPNHRISVN